MKINDFHEKSIEKSEINFFDRLIMCRYTSSEAFWDLLCIPKTLEKTDLQYLSNSLSYANSKLKKYFKIL